MLTLTCIKPGCGKLYKSEDPDPYYCEICNQERKALAAEIDKKLAGVVSTRQVTTPLQEFEQQAVTYTTEDGRKISFLRG